MKKLILKEFSYSFNILNKLKESEIDNLLKLVLEYIFTRMFLELPEKKLNRIRLYVDNNKMDKLLDICPNFFNLVQKYGREYRNTHNN